MRAKTSKDREEHLNEAKYNFKEAVRNAQGTIKPYSRDVTSFYDHNMLQQAVSELCGTLKKSILFHWKDSAPVLNITEVHPKDIFSRHEYNITEEFDLIKAIDCGKLPSEKKREIAEQVCECINACFTDYSLSTFRRQEINIPDLKEFRTYARIAGHYGLSEHKDTVMKIWLRMHGIELEGMEKLGLDKLLYG
ncbi:MAG: hypothetical protein KGH60_01635 [Candidatus Micrarchaeota archaeon]|nr:hypothetical protein [Candidatus Micrarchaeota archaeon]